MQNQRHILLKSRFDDTEHECQKISYNFFIIIKDIKFQNVETNSVFFPIIECFSISVYIYLNDMAAKNLMNLDRHKSGRNESGNV